MTLRKLVAIVAVLSLCLPALTWAGGSSTPWQTAQADMSQVQARLQTLGLYQGPIDGNYGPQTAEALVAYQQMQGLRVTGTLTSETHQALFASAAPADNPGRTEPAGNVTTALATGAVGTAAGATLGAIAGSAAIGAAIGGPIGLAVGALGGVLWSQLRS
jgi:peptidoglycan hydrolase-like protein with peptidoglycan-binding domain